MDTKKLRQKILDLAIHGKLVPQDPNDEPASVLLERIRAEKERLVKEGKIKKSKASKTSDTPHYENVPFEVPESWCVVSLSELFMINPKNEVEDNAEVGFIPMTNVEDGFSGDHTFEVREWKGVKKGYCHFQNGDIGVAKISPCFENLKSCIFHSLPNGFGAGTTELVILRSMGVYSPFYLYLFKSTWYISQGTKYFKGVVGQQRVNKAIFTELEVPLPSYGEQQRIVAEIEEWFAFIDIIESGKTDLQTTIKQTKSKILDLAIHGKLVPQVPNDEPASELLKRINPAAEITCDNGQYGKVTFEIPYNWCWQRLGDINDIARGGSPRPIKDYLTDDEDGVNWIKIGDTSKDEKYINSVKEKIRVEGVKKSRMVHKGDFLLTNSMSFGRPYILNVDGCIHDGWLVISPKGNAYNADFLYYLLSSTFAYDQFAEVASGGVVTNLNSDKVADTMFPLPPLPEQYRIVAKIEELFTSLDNIQKALEV